MKKDDIYSRYYQIYDLTNKYYQNNLNTVNGKKQELFSTTFF